MDAITMKDNHKIYDAVVGADHGMNGLEKDNYNLLSSILVQAFKDLNSRKLADNSRSWFITHNPEDLFSFSSVCDLLGLEKSTILRRAAQVCQSIGYRDAFPGLLRTYANHFDTINN